jgi:hypothetical protein
VVRAVLVASVASLAVALASACSDDRSAGGANGSDASADAAPPAPPSPCEATRAFVEACGGDLTCGPEAFDAWCEENDRAINSDAYRRAEATCLTEENCAPASRRRCEYGSYRDETPTAAQAALVRAYCQSCEPGDVDGCAERETTFAPGSDPSQVSDLFIAAWELADDLVDDIRERCTGGVLDAGADCARAFASCAGAQYVDRLPDCP